MKTASEIYAKVHKQTEGHAKDSLYVIYTAMTEFAQAYHEEKTRWVSVKEELPKEPMNCIVLVPNFIDKVTTREFNPDDGKFLDDRITHWQPLPTPPNKV